MTRLTGRIDKLAKAIPAGRCALCSGWREPRVVVELAPDVELYGSETPPKPPDIPAECPGCGWRPRTMVIRVEEDDVG